MRALAAVLPLLLLIAACSAPQRQAAGPQEQAAASPQGRVSAPGEQAAIRLSAELVSPDDIALRWDGRDPDAAGRVLEFATEPGGPYTILAFLPPEQATFTHPDLIPHTTFHYRLRPYYGRPSAPVEVRLGGGPHQEPEPGWSQPRTIAGGPRGTLPTGSGQAAPAGLKATVTQADGVAFTWTDRSGDEDGFLLENRPAGRAGFRVVAALDPDVNAFGLVTLPEERRAAYRVRAFRYGPPSNVVHRTTGGE
ncbi:fibronectin type III domain-containing protein [Nonomuraea basaltis]|uniref:fibronectin type III domain-containing protein n=1 Tax=Nonomuraea basaltis TaxID=2495887 RepID=UPI00110C4D16|nr:fibronectin type III domain-containing protein [Nonomuraea basaltis]TMR94644.1 fibronectin type III domain-containing protein [Nonomuraea basaltis]